MVEEFDEDEQVLVDTLINTGLNKNVAKALVYIASNEGAKSREIENAVRLRQPEVSISVKELREKGWVTTEKEKKEGKGRPVHLYYLDKPIEKIIANIEKAERGKVEEIEDNLDEMKSLAEKL